jgi:hypothetical protein
MAAIASTTGAGGFLLFDPVQKFPRVAEKK